jgi:hypothetical protein
VVVTLVLTVERPGAADLPLECSLVQDLLPALHSRAWKQRNGRDGYTFVVSKAQEVRHRRRSTPARALLLIDSHVCLQRWTEAEAEQYFVFGAEEWARHTMELLSIYQRTTNERQRLSSTPPTQQRCRAVRDRVRSTLAWWHTGKRFSRRTGSYGW